ncbi:sulfotransferase [Reichenbachiella faecimaris]|uniref:Sulfotransferase n=1 Tax=Reichenbachiella faecimaris TaxID=692418 RepID=A0A1W2GC60_REIFA|nr:sulfotransferase domain-containing protein [Reichenbachiella faecimaris]SMD33876.1 sulfotransferase [Reichenbachiella faecimaris]
MDKLHFVSGFPRSGSTLLCNLLNMTDGFFATPTSPTLDMVLQMRKVFSHNVSYKNMDRLTEEVRFQRGMKAYLQSYFADQRVVFDKNRGWVNKLPIVDRMMEDEESKVIFCYRNPVEVFQSIENQYQRTIMMENVDESQNTAGFTTLYNRVETFIADNFTLMSTPVALLEDALTQGHGHRILIVRYDKLCAEPQQTLNMIHQFVGEPPQQYDFSQLKQTTFENDAAYNYKFSHKIREGEVTYSPTKITLPKDAIDRINKRFHWIISRVEKSE